MKSLMFEPFDGRGDTGPAGNATGRRSGRPMREDPRASLSTASVPAQAGTFNAAGTGRADQARLDGRGAAIPAVPSAADREPLLSSVSKVGACLQLPPIMACPARSIALHRCKQRGSTCVCDPAVCYAQKGNGRQPRVRTRRADRLEFWRQDPAGWTRQLLQEVRPLSRVRLFSSGDFVDIGMLDAIGQVAAATPTCRFWAPTKTWLLGTAWTTALQRLHALPNVNVLLSLPGVDDMPQDYSGLLCPGMPVARVYDKTAPIGHACPAVLHHSSCDQEGCSACLNKNTGCVNYALHSRRC